MCGICGIYNGLDGELVSGQVIEEMMQLLDHRGPDARGKYVDGPLGLGFTRLSIIDLVGGQQPMSNEAADIWLVCNGEIWNYQPLRKQLIERGHLFNNDSDVEVIIHAYEEYGLDCFAHLHGMFGLAIWDAPRKRLVLARDRVGKKPLYYTNCGEKIIFASEIKSLLCHPDVKREVNLQAVTDFLSVRYVPAPETLFAGIYKVLPGQALIFEDGRMHEQCYWDFTSLHPQERSLSTMLAEIKDHIAHAVEQRMMADVPIGAFLSGGVDSSIIVGMMSKLASSAVKTFSVGFAYKNYNELPYARLVAEHFGTEHHELVVHAEDLAQYWPLLTWHRDEPVSEPSDLAVYLVSKLARQQVKVVLSGEGADELFAGYPKYVVDWLARYYHLLPRSVRDRIIQPLLEHLPYRMRKLKTAARNLSQPSPQRWMNWFGIFNGSLKDKLLSPSMKAAINYDSSEPFRRLLEQNPQQDDLSSMLYLDTKIWLPDNLLMKADKMTMAASLEARMPMLDYKLIEYAASIPSPYKIKGLKTKYLLKRAFADFLPEQILTRKKMGFNMPTGIWFREGLRETIPQLLLSERMRSRGYFNHDYLEQMIHDHLTGKTNYEAQIFTLASLELWFRVFIDTPNLAMPAGSLTDLV